MLNHLRIFFLLTSVLLIAGCAVALIGLGAAAVGTVAYKNGKLIKTYQAEYNRSVKASRDTLAGLKIPLTDNLSDDLKTVLKANRPDGTPVEITVVRIERNLTEVGVRTGFVGVWDKRVSEQIQNSIGKKLSSGPRTASGYTTDSDRKNVSHLNKEATPKMAAVNESNGTPVSSTPTDISTDREVQGVVKKPSKKQPEFVIYFSANTNELSEDAMEKLNTIAEVIINGRVVEINVKGFSDSNGTSSFNKMVSESRANTVKIYLIGKGIHPKKIIAKGFGSDSPVASNKYENSRKLNRRVEIELIYRKN
jgi:outer membrane protein OmpA-like peptidoglycan-associated protein